MLFPDSAKKAIKSTFYDKTVEVFEVRKDFDEEGGLVESTSKKSEFKANVNYSELGKVFEDLGAKLNASVAITAETSVKIEIGDKMRIDERDFETVEVKRFDSHTLILGKIL